MGLAEDVESTRPLQYEWTTHTHSKNWGCHRSRSGAVHNCTLARESTEV